MSRHFTNKIYLSQEMEDLIRVSEFLGKGNNGVVYRIDEKTIIKIFNEEKVCSKELKILKASCKCPAFPQVYGHGDYYIIRDFVDGIRLDKYLNKKPMNMKIVESIVNLIKDFKKLNYKKLDIRCKDLYVQEDFSLKVIDPKDNFSKTVNFPRHLMKGIYKRNQIGYFFFYLKQIDEDLYNNWRKNFKEYVKSLKEPI